MLLNASESFYEGGVWRSGDDRQGTSGPNLRLVKQPISGGTISPPLSV